MLDIGLQIIRLEELGVHEAAIAARTLLVGFIWKRGTSTERFPIKIRAKGRLGARQAVCAEFGPSPAIT